MNSKCRTAYDLDTLPMNDFISAVKELPKSNDIIEGILPEQQVMLMAGDPWQGKSLENQMLTCAFGAGQSYHGLRLRKCRAIYFTWEGNGNKIADRFSRLASQFEIEPQYMPSIKMLPEKKAINTAEGQAYFISEITKAGATVALFDSFPYTVQGNYSKDDAIINEWWNGLQNIVHSTSVTPIFVWEFTKLSFNANSPQDQFGLVRLKSGYTVAYKVNTVVMIGEERGNKRVDIDGVSTVRWQSLGHKIVVAKAKDANQLEPLTVTLDPNTLLWTGQHWMLNNHTGEYEVIADDAEVMIEGAI